VSSVDAVRLNGFEARLVADINSARRSAGMRPLIVVPGATDVARRWSWRQASVQRLFHNPSIVHDLEVAGSNAWTALSENVGDGPSDDPQALFEAYMNSPPHRENILDRGARYVGVGTVERNGIAWNTLDFVNAYSNSYGHPRVPAAGLTMDRHTITSTTDVAMLEGGTDQRFATRSHGTLDASRLAFTGPSAANDAAVTRLHTRRHNGRALVVMRDALDLSRAHTLSLQLSARNARGHTIPITVMLRRSFGNSVSLGTVRVGNHPRWVHLTLPAAARTFRNALVLRVTGKSVAAAGGRVRLAIYDVRATV
jgi:hypothetical protein